MGDFAIHCHYQSAEKNQIAAFVKEYGLPVIALDETCGVSIEEGEIKVIGHTKADVYFQERVVELAPGQALKLF
ncbi:MAG: hypothetical protein AAF202_13695 [Pseudomonadota bacterium]